MRTEAFPPLSTIGILGGGQLGRMLAQAAAELGFRTHIFCPEENCPAAQVASHVTTAAYDDEAALARFAEAIDVATYEFENVPESAIALLEARMPVRPGRKALSISQDRLAEKKFLNRIGAGTTSFAAVGQAADIVGAAEVTGLPAILKTRRLGYDGKGQARIDPGTDHGEAFTAMGEVPCIVEGFVAFERELSIIIARGMNGDVAAYDAAENEHRDHILWRSHVPGAIPAAQSAQAKEIATKIVESLDYVGVMGVEFFALKDGALLVNEFAPRVHNSGHWTQDACAVSQFEQHIRAAMGWPLGSPARHSNACMENLIGNDVESWDLFAAEPDAHIHLYGKTDARPGRKMGHVTRLAPLHVTRLAPLEGSAGSTGDAGSADAKSD